MSTIFVDATGFHKKTLVELKQELEDEYKAVFGNDIDLDATGPFGQLIGISAQREADLWDGAQEIYTSRNPDEATGTSLDTIVAENGIARRAATATSIQNAHLIGTQGTVIAAGKQANQSNPPIGAESLLYSLDASVTIDAAAASWLQIEPSDPSAGGVTFTVTIDGTPYTKISGVGDTEGDLIDDIKVLIDAGSWGGTVTNISDTYLQLSAPLTPYAVTYTGTWTLNALGSAGDFTADDTGVFAAPETSLDTISTPVAGWDSILNESAGATGKAVETDAELRIRRKQSINKGYATDDAIRAALLDQVDNVISASVTSNRSLITDSEGRPGKSFEAVVEGGTDQDVADKIWEYQPNGIEPFGNTSKTVVDSEGFDQTVDFSRPVSQYAWVIVTRTENTEEEYPSNGDALIKDAIVAWALLNQTVGKDIIRQRLSIPVYEVPGTAEIVIEIAITTTPGGTPSYVTADIVILAREIALFDTTRITVTT